jgi:phosphoribosyl 1,2-cyclic phosphate phosphodiesterase
MRLRFLGTAASEGYPDAFCDCDNCRRAREAGGRSLRCRSAALIDDDLLIDFGPDLIAAALMQGVSLARVRYCLQTHEHADHLDPDNLVSRSADSGVYGNPRLEYYASEGALAKAAAGLGLRGPGGVADPAAGERLNLTTHPVGPFESFEVGPYRVRSVKANHAPEHLTAMLYLIEREGRTLFYATDTGELPEETWADLAARRRAGSPPIHLIALDHTFGMKERVRGHLNADQFLEMIGRMRAEQLLAGDARIFAHHFAHHANPVYEELAAFAAGRGYEIAYDGLVVEV